jgi:hypothetical protein
LVVQKVAWWVAKTAMIEGIRLVVMTADYWVALKVGLMAETKVKL